MGSRNVQYLQGRVGEVDVLDCVTATHDALKKYPWLDPDYIGLSGGSHGGFLVAHLSSQYSVSHGISISVTAFLKLLFFYISFIFVDTIQSCCIEKSSD